jgi:predicted DNA-binding transcriptional regulator AlpA
MGGNTDNDIVVLVKDLSSFGIPYSGKHIRDLVKRGSFPVPFKLSERRLAWWKSEIVAYLSRPPIHTSALRGASF